MTTTWLSGIPFGQPPNVYGRLLSVIALLEGNVISHVYLWFCLSVPWRACNYSPLGPVFKILQVQDCIPVGCVPPTAVAVSPAMQAPPPCMPLTMHAPPTTHAPGHACPLPCMPLPLPQTCMPLCHACPLRHTRPPPPVNRITDTCKNITFPQFRLRTVDMYLEIVVESLEQPDVLVLQTLREL